MPPPICQPVEGGPSHAQSATAFASPPKAPLGLAGAWTGSTPSGSRRRGRGRGGGSRGGRYRRLGDWPSGGRSGSRPPSEDRGARGNPLARPSAACRRAADDHPSLIRPGCCTARISLVPGPRDLAGVPRRPVRTGRRRPAHPRPARRAPPHRPGRARQLAGQRLGQRVTVASQRQPKLAVCRLPGRPGPWIPGVLVTIHKPQPHPAELRPASHHGAQQHRAVPTDTSGRSPARIASPITAEARASIWSAAARRAGPMGRAPANPAAGRPGAAGRAAAAPLRPRPQGPSHATGPPGGVVPNADNRGEHPRTLTGPRIVSRKSSISPLPQRDARDDRGGAVVAAAAVVDQPDR